MKFSIVLGLTAALATVSHAQPSALTPAERYVAELASNPGLVASSNLVRSDADSVSERSELNENVLVERIVGTVKCTPYKTGTLQARTKDGSLANARFSTPAHGVDGTVPTLLTSINGKPLSPQTFTFSTCNGTFMGTSPSTGAFEGSAKTKFTYGHLSNSHAVDKSCVQAFELGVLNKPQYLVKRPCSASDDSGQLFQWWEMVEVPDKSGKTTMYLQFLGQPQDGTYPDEDFKGSYSLVKRSATLGKGDSSVDVTYVGVENLYGQGVTNGYQLVLS
ncbi:unnamed protein product [Tilletia controversa]|nr:hypothetical protein CF336_g2361 [Tilletia laevis]KAE8200307.1 hypothetical protein CF328_g3005 [Tilletia controversa]CAD6918736.1 unnamed protein product [Tilletia controversa]CAD6928384.1 unnamed protein product [Tilletia controversa]CAD6929799.1 unnamed protein product [Tilletia controversa]